MMMRFLKIIPISSHIFTSYLVRIMHNLKYDESEPIIKFMENNEVSKMIKIFTKLNFLQTFFQKNY